MISDLCERGDCETCFDDEIDGCRCGCHPTDRPAGEVVIPTTEESSPGITGRAAYPVDGLPRTVRAARATVPGGPSSSSAPLEEEGGKTSPQPGERQAAGRPDPGAGREGPAADHRMPTRTGRGRTRAPAPVTRAARLDRDATPVRVPGKTLAGGAHASPREANGVLPAGQKAIAAAMSEDRGPDSLEAHLRRLMKDLGLTGFHVEKSLDVEKNRKNVSVKGWPDWTIRGPRGVLFRELKSQRGKVEPEQREWLDALTAAGHNAAVWRPASLLSGAIAAELAAISAWRVRRGSRCVCDAYGSCPQGCAMCRVCGGDAA